MERISHPIFVGGFEGISWEISGFVGRFVGIRWENSGSNYDQLSWIHV